MTKSTSILQMKQQQASESETTPSRGERLKRQYSAYDAPTLKEFLWVIGVFALLMAFSWVAYYKVGWFH